MYYLRAYRAKADATPNVMTFVASTGGVKRDGVEIDQTRWRLDDYQRNPFVLWAHDYSSLPIGRAHVYLDDDRLMADVEWDTADDFAKRVP